MSLLEQFYNNIEILLTVKKPGDQFTSFPWHLNCIAKFKTQTASIFVRKLPNLTTIETDLLGFLQQNLNIKSCDIQKERNVEEVKICRNVQANPFEVSVNKEGQGTSRRSG